MNKKIKIGIINIMPNAFQYEQLLRAALFEASDMVEIYPIRLTDHQYCSSSSVIEKYSTFRQTIEHTPLDLLIITGAPVENLPFEEISYWEELREILSYAGEHFKSVLGICFGGLAIAKYLGINKRVLSEKLYGVYQFSLDANSGNYFQEMRTYFHMPLSTWAILDTVEVSAALGKSINGIARHPEIGYTILESMDRKFSMILGHPEYTVDTLKQEWERDLKNEVPYTANFNEASFCEMKKILSDETNPIIENWIISHFSDVFAETV